MIGGVCASTVIRTGGTNRPAQRVVVVPPFQVPASDNTPPKTSFPPLAACQLDLGNAPGFEFLVEHSLRDIYGQLPDTYDTHKRIQTDTNQCID